MTFRLYYGCVTESTDVTVHQQFFRNELVIMAFFRLLNCNPLKIGVVKRFSGYLNSGLVISDKI